MGTIKVEGATLVSLKKAYDQQKAAADQIGTYVRGNCTLDGAFGLLLLMLKPVYESGRDSAFSAFANASKALSGMGTQVEGALQDSVQRDQNISDDLRKLQDQIDVLRNRIDRLENLTNRGGGGGFGGGGSGGGYSGGGGSGGSGHVPSPLPGAAATADAAKQAADAAAKASGHAAQDAMNAAAQGAEKAAGHAPTGAGLTVQVEVNGHRTAVTLDGHPGETATIQNGDTKVTVVERTAGTAGSPGTITIDVNGHRSTVALDEHHTGTTSVHDGDATVTISAAAEPGLAEDGSKGAVAGDAAAAPGSGTVPDQAKQSPSYSSVWDHAAAEDPLRRSPDELRAAWESRDGIRIPDAQPAGIGYETPSLLPNLGLGIATTAAQGVSA